MPTYDYVCDACEHEFELFQRMSDDPIKKCPECNKRKLRRLYGTGAAVVFKGSGFYQTDYRSQSYKKGADAAKKASESKSSEKKSDGSKSTASDKKKSSGSSGNSASQNKSKSD